MWLTPAKGTGHHNSLSCSLGCIQRRRVPPRVGFDALPARESGEGERGGGREGKGGNKREIESVSPHTYIRTYVHEGRHTFMDMQDWGGSKPLLRSTVLYNTCEDTCTQQQKQLNLSPGWAV